MTTSPEAIAEAVTRLDADIKAAEARLANLRGRRASLDEFIADYLPGATASITELPTRPLVPANLKVVGSGASAIVEKVLREHGWADFTVAELYDAVISEGHALSRDQVGNAVTYLGRPQVHIVEKRPGRGNWTRILPSSTEGPAEAEPSDQLPSPFSPEAGVG